MNSDIEEDRGWQLPGQTPGRKKNVNKYVGESAKATYRSLYIYLYMRASLLWTPLGGHRETPAPLGASNCSTAHEKASGAE